MRPEAGTPTLGTHPYVYSFVGPVLQVKSLNLTYPSAEGPRTVLSDLSFTVLDVRRPGHSQGQILGLLGPSGIGKTSILRCLAGLQAPTSGEIWVGLDPKPTAAGLVGVVFQHYPLFAHRTVLGNLLVAGRQAGLGAKAAEAKAMELLKTFGLADRTGAWPAQLSGGQRQRVAIAQQLMCSEHLLLMDEPFSGLDPVMKGRACKLIQDVAAMHEENTIVIVTHDVESAVRICDQVIVLGKEKGAGARVVANVDLKERGIAWRPDPEAVHGFRETVNEIKAMFPEN